MNEAAKQMEKLIPEPRPLAASAPELLKNGIIIFLCKADPSSSDIRELSTVISDSYRRNLLPTLQEELITKFTKHMSEMIAKEAADFPFTLIEILLTIFAAPEMPQRVYDGECIMHLAQKLQNFAEHVFKVNPPSPMAHRLFPSLGLFANVVANCYLPDSTLYSLVSLGIESYFYTSASSSLQTSACAILSSIFKKNVEMRSYLLDEILMGATLDCTQKLLLLSDGIRKPIAAFSRLIFEIVQTITSFPLDTEEESVSVIQEIIQRLLDQSHPHSTFFLKLLESFAYDCSLCLLHPSFPVAEAFVMNLIALLLPQISKKSRISRTSVKIISCLLKNLIQLFRRSKETLKIRMQNDFFDTLHSYDKAQIEGFIKSPGSHFSKTETEVIFEIDISFPLNDFEKVAGRSLIVQYLRQSYLLSDSPDTALQYHVSQWSAGELTQLDLDLMLSWWRNVFPDLPKNILKIDEIEKISLSFMMKRPLFTHLFEVIHRYLLGLNNKNSSLRSMVLHGFSSFVEVDSSLLYHPQIIPHLESAFADPCASIRDATLEILSAYIAQNEKFLSPYFTAIVRCLSDSSNEIVRRALLIIGSLAATATNEQLCSLSEIICSRLLSENEKIASAATQILSHVLFDYSLDPSSILVYVISKTLDKPKWLSTFFKDQYFKHSECIKSMISKLCTSSSHTTVELRLIAELSELFPRLFVEYNETMLNAFLSTTEDNQLALFAQIIIPIIPRLSIPNISLFSLLSQFLVTLIYNKPSTIVRPSVQLLSDIQKFILPSDPSLPNLQLQFNQFLRSKLTSTVADKTNILRAIFVSGCIFRYFGAQQEKSFGRSLLMILTHHFRSEDKDIRRMALQGACDICSRDSSLIDSAKNLVQTCFDSAEPSSALNFLSTLMQEESVQSENLALDEIKPNYSATLIHSFFPKIAECMVSSESDVRTSALKLSKVSLSYGMINPLDIIPFIIALVCTADQHTLALETLKDASLHSEDAISHRIVNGFCEATKIKSEKKFSFTEVLSTLGRESKRTALKALVKKCKTYFSTEVNCDELGFLLQSLAKTEFREGWEPNYLVKSLNGKAIMGYIGSSFSDAKSTLYSKGKEEIEPKKWKASTMVLIVKHWLIKRYQIKLKNVSSKSKDFKSGLKVAKIGTFEGFALPEIKEDKRLCDEIIDLFVAFRNQMRVERVIGGGIEVEE